MALFQKPFRIEAHEVPVTVKSGLACRGSSSLDAEALVQNAEAGLRQAKAAGELDGAEALLRWDDPERGIVPPGEFLPILESTGMIVSVGEWALHQAAADCRR